MPQEIERKFLVVNDSYKTMAYAKTHITQGYLTKGRRRSVRIRIRDDKGYITVKGPSSAGGMSRYEWEKEIPLQEARDLMALCAPELIDKYRYLVKCGRHVFEVDEFHGGNEGLIMAEVELKAEHEPYVKPSFIGKEVTGDRRFYNAYLSTHPFSAWGAMENE